MSCPNTLTKELPRISIIQDIRTFEEDFTVLNDGPEVTAKLLELTESIDVSGKQIHDANIATTMLVNNVFELLTHNVSDFKKFHRHIKVTSLVA